jgi:transposase
MEGCANGLWPAQDAVQPLRALEPSRDLQQDIPRVVTAARDERVPDDRRHAPEGSQNCGQPAQKGALPRCIGRTKGGLNSKLHAVCDGTGKPVRLLLTAGQTSDYTGARHLLPSLPRAQPMIADRGYDADWLVAALKKKGIKPCIPPRNNRKKKRRYSKQLYKQRHNIEVMFGRIKDWRRIAMRYERCAHTFFSAICIAATVIFYLKE